MLINWIGCATTIREMNHICFMAMVGYICELAGKLVGMLDQKHIHVVKPNHET
jgi:hypothetical protein